MLKAKNNIISSFLHYYKLLSLIYLYFKQLKKVSKYYPHYIKYFIRTLMSVTFLTYLKVKTCNSQIKKVKKYLMTGN